MEKQLAERGTCRSGHVADWIRNVLSLLNLLVNAARLWVDVGPD